MTKEIEFTTDVFESGRRVHAAGERAAATEKLARWVRRGAAREVDAVLAPPEVGAKTRGKRAEVPPPTLPLEGGQD